MSKRLPREQYPLEKKAAKRYKGRHQGTVTGGGGDAKSLITDKPEGGESVAKGQVQGDFARLASSSWAKHPDIQQKMGSPTKQKKAKSPRGKK